MSDDSGSTKGALTCEDIRHFRAVLPPLEEQHRIVRWTQNAIQETEAAIHLASREIKLLDEYRIRLIADVVTGKLDVREAAARLPEEPDDAEFSEDTETLGEEDESPAETQEPEAEETS